jgi:two-component system, NtrC family, sensor histidine kinase AtoS
LTEPLLLLQNIRHRFGEREALRGVDFDLYPREIHALIGERKAGKSTLARIVSGDLRKQTGRILLRGREVPWLTPRSALRQGIGIIYQNLSVLPTLSLAENVFAGHMPHFSISPRDRRRMDDECRDLLRRFSLDIDMRRPVGALSETDQQIVELLRLFSLDLAILILDDISSRRTPSQMAVIFRILDDLRAKGKAIIYISSDIDEVLRLADRVTVFKDGLRTGTELVQDMDRVRLFSLAYSFALNRDPPMESGRALAVNRVNEELIQSLPTGAVLLNAEGRVALANSAAESLAAEPRTSFRGMSLAEVLDALELPQEEQREEVARAAGERRSRTWNALFYGSGRTMRLKLSPLWDADAFQGTMLFFDDVSMDPQVKEYLSRADQVASIAELAAGVAHEINNPLSILQNSIILARLPAPEEERAENLARMERELERIVEIVQSLLSFSRVNQAPKKRTNIASLFEEVLLLLSHKLNEKDVAVRRDWPDEPVILPVIENKIRQLLVNLVVNAYEAVLRQGEIRVSVRANVPAGVAEIRVSDNGYGIAPEIRSQVFQPFFTTKISKTNTGLGLSICQHIVELHAGLITFESVPGSTTFTVQLPLR